MIDKAQRAKQLHRNSPVMGWQLDELRTLIASHAADIAALLFESDQLRHVKLGLEVQVMGQAAEIAALREQLRLAQDRPWQNTP